MTGTVGGDAASGLGPDIAVFDSRPLPESVRAAVDEFDVDELVELVLERCASEVFGPFAQDEEFRTRLRASIRQNAYALRDVLAGRSALADVVLDRLLELATVQAQMRVPRSRPGSARTGSATSCNGRCGPATSAAAARSGGLSAKETADALTQLTRVALSCRDHVASKVAEGYAREQEALNRSRTHVRRSLVRDVLAGKAGELTGLRHGDPRLPPRGAPRRRPAAPEPRGRRSSWPTASRARRPRDSGSWSTP